tara:strand:+ start:379 stop:783 length:405 start_codon:yes stop_codon:yes gene_type:complete
MASVREIDRNEDVFVGVRFPLDHSQEGFFYKTKTILEQAKANMRNLLLTSLGERVMQPEFGSTLMDVIFNQGPDVENDIDEAIREAVSNWLPYVLINEINMFQEGNQVDVSIDFSVSLEPDSFDTITFNFNIGE